MSNITPSNINQNFPEPGKDNDSVGFRNNFSAIKDALAVAKAELADLQAKAIVKSKLDVNSVLNNNLQGANINNGTHTQFYESFYSVSAISEDVWPVDLNQGPVQQFVLTMPTTTFSFVNWTPSINQVSKVRMIIKADSSSTYTVAFSNPGFGLTYEIGFPSPLTVSGDHVKVVDVWTVDGGASLFVQLVGSF